MLYSYLVIFKTSWSILPKLYLPGYTVQGEFLKLCLPHKDVSKEMKSLFIKKRQLIDGKTDRACLKGTSKGIFICTSDFTQDAIANSKMNPHNRIILINGQKLVD
jgi:hypothetical protein